MGQPLSNQATYLSPILTNKFRDSPRSSHCEARGWFSILIDIDMYPSRLQILALLSAAYAIPSRDPDPMVGDQIQTQWQLDSKRSAIPWWNRINYGLTVWRLEALQSRGEFSTVILNGSLHVRLPKSVSRQILRYYDAVLAFKKRPGADAQLLHKQPEPP